MGVYFDQHWHQLLINGKLIYFHSWKSYFCSFSFHSVFLIPWLISFKGRPSCCFTMTARWGLPGQLMLPGRLWAPLGWGSWWPDRLMPCVYWWGLLHAVMLLISYNQHTRRNFNFGGSGGLFPHSSILRACSLKICNHQWIVLIIGYENAFILLTMFLFKCQRIARIKETTLAQILFCRLYFVAGTKYTKLLQ